MRELPPNVDADVVIEVGRYLDDHAKTTAVSISDAIRVVRRRAPATRASELWLEELIVESAGTRQLAVLLDNR
ncbi:hypothetical protein EOA75_11280 [Mesorhizobium sp. M1A.F.Ca.IN.022.07.1.1]|uniref:hypothetical protein n=1 Tax=unclassified Mesorhizobium TaxID=325217 RepID=UPI000F74CD90|nr:MULTISPECIES: hypothetical protein [unclassified Mesorhizobium]TGV92952.1 hypothetical protein EN801_007455 [Mesorhizobium sp. M00.F.Ca.ET.158.01.1.1]AZO62000.1 hypothetical protein EJ078_24220 [Mesorhizobium sp. M1A.F.Ca.IN.022.06.1.1]MCT2580743.1 hypothetical protein [Mesorhizobium sp. P13.3]MDF3169685.1 hypothetical protein [Mesorhizobium sp. P16.1]MDF3179463.1 hypothetical protein [Mesorhizobium sp. P17.1]